MLTPLTSNIELWIFICTALVGVGTYKFITKQNSEQIKALGDKFDSMRMDVKVEQATLRGNFERLDDTVNRIEKDTTITREKSNELSQAVARIQVKLETIENRSHKNEQP